MIGGIYIDEMEQKVLVTLANPEGGRMTNSADINAAIIKANEERGKSNKNHGVVLKNGTYDIDESINMMKYVSIIGEDRYKVVCQINPVMGSTNAKNNQVYAFHFASGDEYYWIVFSQSRAYVNNVNGDKTIL